MAVAGSVSVSLVTEHGEYMYTPNSWLYGNIQTVTFMNRWLTISSQLLMITKRFYTIHDTHTDTLLAGHT